MYLLSFFLTPYWIIIKVCYKEISECYNSVTMAAETVKNRQRTPKRYLAEDLDDEEFTKVCFNQCCGAGPFLTGSGSRYFFSPAPAPFHIKIG